jgi:hypothetical protein
MSSQDKLTARQLHKAITAGSAAALRCNTEGGAGAGADKRLPAADMVLQDVEDDPESPQAPRAGAAATTAPEAGKAETVFQAFDDWPCSAYACAAVRARLRAQGSSAPPCRVSVRFVAQGCAAVAARNPSSTRSKVAAT